VYVYGDGNSQYVLCEGKESNIEKEKVRATFMSSLGKDKKRRQRKRQCSDFYLHLFLPFFIHSLFIPPSM